MEKHEDFDQFLAKVRKIVLDPWDLTACDDSKIRIELRDTDDSIFKNVNNVDSSLHFSMHFFNLAPS